MEPIAITVRELGHGKGVKMIWWFIARVTGDGKKVEGTLAEYEQMDSFWLDADQAADRLTFTNDGEVVTRAVELVTAEVTSGRLKW